MIVWIERFLMRLTDVVIAISESQRWELTEKYRIAPSYKITTKELGFNLELFFNNESKKGNFRRNLGIDGNRLLIGIIGRLVPIKNHKMFLDRRNSVNFVIICERLIISRDQTEHFLLPYLFQYFKSQMTIKEHVVSGASILWVYN